MAYQILSSEGLYIATKVYQLEMCPFLVFLQLSTFMRGYCWMHCAWLPELSFVGTTPSNSLERRCRTVSFESLCISLLLGGCPFNGPLSVMKYPTRESPRRDAASPIKYNGLRVPQPSSWGHCAQPAVPYRNIMDWPAVLFSTAAVA